jgi:heme-degrading monooxygenase HmoA
MKAKFLIGLICMSLFSHYLFAQIKNTDPQTNTPKSSAMKFFFIDKFIVPEKAKAEFTERMNINRNFIKKLPGFIEDAAYERTDNQGNMICITIATWENENALAKAKEAVQAEYKKQGFDMPAMLRRLGIKLDRGLYQKVDN